MIAPWMNGYLIRLSRRKKRMYKEYSEVPTVHNHCKYHDARRFYTREARRIRREFETGN